MFDSKEYRTAMTGVLERFDGEMKKVRTGRAHPDMLAGVKVEAYGQWMPINQVANVTIGDATMLLVTPFDPSTIGNITSAIRADSTLGLNPTDDGRLIRVPVPPLTEERRREIVKTASAKVEEAKIGLRNVREDARKEIKTAELPEDVRKKAEKEMDDMTAEFTKQVEDAFKAKEAEIMKL